MPFYFASHLPLIPVLQAGPKEGGKDFFCVKMPKILIVSIPPLPALLNQALGSALIPSDQQKYSENPIIPPKLRYLAANSLLDFKGSVSFNGLQPVQGRSSPFGAWEGTGWVFQGKGQITGKSEGSLDAVTSPHLCTCLLPQRLNPNPKGLNLCVLLGQPPSFPAPLRTGEKRGRFCQVLVNNL